jgi:hypothetical protein
MHQLEIKFFYPLTEQIPLGLDFSPCYDYDAKKRLTFATVCVANGGVQSATYTTCLTNTGLSHSMYINVDQTPVTVVSKNKPNIFRRYLYKIMGVDWKVK